MGAALAAGLLALTAPLLGARSAAASPTAAAGAAPARSTVPGSAALAQAQAQDYDALYGTYGAQLARLRAGDEQAREPLLAAAERLARVHGRADALAVARYFLERTREERLEGAALEEELNRLRTDLRDAFRQEVRDADWDALRAELVGALDELVERASAAPELSAAPRALALRALLDVERVERDDRLSAAQREELLRDAQAAAERGLTLFEQVGMKAPTLEPALVLARVDRARGREALAREQYASAAELAAEVRQPAWRAKALQGMVDLALERGDLDEVERVLLELVRSGAPGDGWYVRQRHAQTLLAQDQPEEAREELLAARPTGERALGEWRLILGSTLLRCGQPEEARALYRELPESLALEREIALAAVELRAGEPAAARARLESLALEGERADRRAKGLVWRGEARLACGDAAGAVDALEEALAQAELWRARYEHAQGLHDPVVNVHGEVLGLHATVLLARANAALGRGLAAAAAIERTQARSLAALPEGTRADEQLRAWAASSSQGLVTWAVGADAAVVAHVAADGTARAWPIARGRRAVEGATRLVREAATAPRADPELLRARVRQVRDELLPLELRRRLAPGPGEAGEALFLLHGALEDLPVELLLALDEEEGLERLVARVLPGLPAAEPGPPVAPGELARWSLLGDPWPASDRLELALPGAGAELDELARLYPDSRLARGPAFDREALLAALSGKLPLHVATHFVPGCGSPTARLSGVGIVLSGTDLLCPLEVLAARPALPLVVLSGCESHTGRVLDAEGLLGTARAFLEAGTRNLLVTLWPVEDQAAREVALAFHRALRAGHAPARAAHEARASLRLRGAAAADWAAFRLLGRD